ncbi:hypothetical protein LXL04_003553 [Taraxacum kok-saghyz]
MAPSSIQIPRMDQAIQEQKPIFEVEDEVEVTERGDGKVLVELVDFKNIRPKPIDFCFKFKWGDNVDVWITDRWHKGRYVSDVGRKKSACILYTTDEEETVYFDKEDVRASVNWKYVEGESTWTFSKVICRMNLPPIHLLSFIGRRNLYISILLDRPIEF